ncbi:LlaJI family restriction endonuclease [Lactococcus petauri]|nr:LlaJI family restriction endonuclease [Lactococcus petauri]
MKLQSFFLREQKRYSQAELFKIFDLSEIKTVKILRKLKEYGVLKTVKNGGIQKNLTNLVEDDVEIVDVEVGENEYLYVFTYVGVITINSVVIKIYPKYILSTDTPTLELKQVIKVLEKYNSKEQIIRMYNETNDSSTFNLLAVILFLLKDYFEYGPYTNTEDIIETNGLGDILWDRTINDTFTIISKNRPYYPELQTRKRINNDFDYFKRLHEAVLTRCSRELEQSQLMDLFDIEGVNLSDEPLSDFGETEFILEQINKELAIQFNTRKQLLLKTLYAYVLNDGALADIDSLSMFGTNSFNLVWEKVCAEVLNNQLQSPLGILDLPVKLDDSYDKNKSLISIIEKPNWLDKKSDGTVFNRKAVKTLIPDIISISKFDDDYQITILDAKYYNLRFTSEMLEGQPGIESITKQYLYQLCYKEFANTHQITKIKNCFLYPTENERIIEKGFVEMKILGELGLEKIQNRMLPAQKMYSLYLQNKKLSVKQLNLI